MLETGYFRPSSPRRPATATPCGPASWCTCASRWPPAPCWPPAYSSMPLPWPPAAPEATQVGQHRHHRRQHPGPELPGRRRWPAPAARAARAAGGRPLHAAPVARAGPGPISGEGPHRPGHRQLLGQWARWRARAATRAWIFLRRAARRPWPPWPATSPAPAKPSWAAAWCGWPTPPAASTSTTRTSTSSWCSPASSVRAGDTLGLVGNTGNARTTAPHLHFGIYRAGRGAVDPWPFLHRADAVPLALAGPAGYDPDRRGEWVRPRSKPGQPAAARYPAPAGAGPARRLAARGVAQRPAPLRAGQRRGRRAASAPAAAGPWPTKFGRSPWPTRLHWRQLAAAYAGGRAGRKRGLHPAARPGGPAGLGQDLRLADFNLRVTPVPLRLCK